MYVINAKPARIHRFRPDPENVYDARNGAREPWTHLADLTGNAATKCENILYHGGWLYVTTGDGYGYQQGADGTVYRIRVSDT